MDPQFPDSLLQTWSASEHDPARQYDEPPGVGEDRARLARALIAARAEIEKLGDRMLEIFAAFDEARPYVSGIGCAGRVEDEARAVVATLKATAESLKDARTGAAVRASELQELQELHDRIRSVGVKIPEGPGTAIAIRLKGWERDQVIAWARATERAGEKNARRNEWLAALALLDVIDGARDHHAVPCHTGTDGEDHDGPIRDWRCVACGEEIVGPEPQVAPCTRPHEPALERTRAPRITREHRAEKIAEALRIVEPGAMAWQGADVTGLAEALLDVDEERALLGATKLWQDEDPEGFTAHTINAVQRATIHRVADYITRKAGATRRRIVAELRRAEPQLVTPFEAKPPGREAVAYAVAVKVEGITGVKLKPRRELDKPSRRVVANAKRAKKRSKRRAR